MAQTFREATYLADQFRLRNSQDEAFVIGGSSLYGQALPLVSKIYLTRVHQYVEGDKYLPTGWLKDFSMDMQSKIMTSRTGIQYTFLCYLRK